MVKVFKISYICLAPREYLMQNTELDTINWHELLREIETIFLAVTNDDEPLQKHTQQVLKNLEYLRDNFEIQQKDPQQQEVNSHYPISYFLDKTVDYVPLINVLDQVSELLKWEQGYDRLPGGMKGKFAFCNLLGHNGHMYDDKMVIGVMLLGKDCYYPAHVHDDIQELYVCIGGNLQINGAKISQGQTSFISNSQPHTLKTGDNPALLLYSWLGSKHVLSENRMRFV